MLVYSRSNTAVCLHSCSLYSITATLGTHRLLYHRVVAHPRKIAPFLPRVARPRCGLERAAVTVLPVRHYKCCGATYRTLSQMRTLLRVLVPNRAIDTCYSRHRAAFPLPLITCCQPCGEISPLTEPGIDRPCGRLSCGAYMQISARHRAHFHK